MTTYLYRAVSTEPHTVIESDWNELGEEETVVSYVEPAGMILGRQTGYLARSSAVDAGFRSGLAFEVVRSEPVEFLTDTERLRRQIQRLTAQLAELEAVTA